MVTNETKRVVKEEEEKKKFCFVVVSLFE